MAKALPQWKIPGVARSSLGNGVEEKGKGGEQGVMAQVSGIGSFSGTITRLDKVLLQARLSHAQSNTRLLHVGAGT